MRSLQKQPFSSPSPGTGLHSLPPRRHWLPSQLPVLSGPAGPREISACSRRPPSPCPPLSGQGADPLSAVPGPVTCQPPLQVPCLAPATACPSIPKHACLLHLLPGPTAPAGTTSASSYSDKLGAERTASRRDTVRSGGYCQSGCRRGLFYCKLAPQTQKNKTALRNVQALRTLPGESEGLHCTKQAHQ